MCTLEAGPAPILAQQMAGEFDPTRHTSWNDGVASKDGVILKMWSKYASVSQGNHPSATASCYRLRCLPQGYIDRIHCSIARGAIYLIGILLTEGAYHDGTEVTCNV